MAEALGSIRIDLSANIAEFTKNVKKAVGSLEDFGRGAGKTINQVDAAFQQLGSKLTLKVTAPLVALGIAAIKAADPTKRMSQEMERAGLRMQKALAPLGEVLIQQLERLKPTLDAAIDTVNGLALKFAALSPEAQRSILAFVGIAAAAGPALLALSAMTSSLKAAALAMRGVWAIGSQLVVMLPMIAAGAAAVGTAFASWKVGEWIYDSFRPVQIFMANMVRNVQNAFADVQANFETVVAGMKAAWHSLIWTITSSMVVTDKVAAAMDALVPGTGSTLKALTFTGITDQAETFAQAQQRIALARMRERAFNDEVLNQSLVDIEKSFAGKGNVDFTVDSPLARMGQDAAALSNAIKGLGTDMQGFMTSAQAAGAGASDAFVQTSQEVEETKRKSKELTDQLKRDMDKAKDLRFAVYPREKLEQDVRNLRALAQQFPQILTPVVVGATIDQWEQDLARLSKKADETFGDRMGYAIKNFSTNVSDTFADMVVDGKASFEDLLRSFEKMLVSMVAKQAIFEPILGAIGGAVGKFMSAPSSTSGGSVPVVHGEYGSGALASTLDLGSTLGRGWQGGGVVVNVIDQSGGVQVKQGKGADGSALIDILVPGMQAAFASTKLDRTMRDNYGISRKARY